MVSSADIFGQARLKLIRAHEHIDQFKLLWSAYLESDFCHLVVEDDPYEPGQTIRVVSVESVPAEMILTIGDAVHNLKSVLDFAVSELLGWQNTRITFPMGETREELISSFRTDGLDPCHTCGRGGKGMGRNAAVEIAVPGIGNFIANEIRPYKAANEFLWPLNKLDVRDKHRLLIPIVVPQSLKGIAARDKNDNGIGFNEVQFRPGLTVNLAAFGSGGVEIQSYGKASAEIFFNEPGIIEGQAVLPTLMNMSQAVAQTLDRIQEFAISVGWQRAS